VTFGHPIVGPNDQFAHIIWPILQNLDPMTNCP
jgi:hypothetical protein